MSDTWKERAEQAERALAVLREAVAEIIYIIDHTASADECGHELLERSYPWRDLLASLPPPATPETKDSQ